MPNSYRVRDLREYDRNVMQGGKHFADRVLETVPFCWMCPETTGTSTNEHVFALRLLREFPPELTRFEPIRLTSVMKGAQLGSHRGPFPGTALVSGSVCASCNNGWMSQLETDARPYLLAQSTVIKGDSLALLARWFAKTAIVINVSQPYRLLWDDAWRHQAQTRVPDNLAISLYRVPEADVNWVQGSAMSMQLAPSGIDMLEISRLTSELTHVCRIQVGTLVGIVVAYPWQLSASALTMPGHLLWSHGQGFDVDIDALPQMDGLLGGEPFFDVTPSAFWAGTGLL